MRFTWDPHKAATNQRKHGVMFAEAVSVFGDPLALIVEDPRHADRAHIIGESARRRILLTVFIEVDPATIRIISARPATSHERRRYEEGQDT